MSWREVEAATVVARRAVDGRDTTTRHVVETLATTTRPYHLSDAGDALAQAMQHGLVVRFKRTQRGGGYHYRYEPTPLLVAYVEAESLARELSQALRNALQAIQATGRPPR